MCIERADTIINPLKRRAVAAPSQVRYFHTSAGVQTSEVAARPLQCQPSAMVAPFTHIDSTTFDRGGFNSNQRAGLKLSRSRGVRR